MNDFMIFVEGIADKVFIRQYIAFIEGVPIRTISEEKIIQCSGRANLWVKKEVKANLSEAIDESSMQMPLQKTHEKRLPMSYQP